MYIFPKYAHCQQKSGDSDLTFEDSSHEIKGIKDLSFILLSGTSKGPSGVSYMILTILPSILDIVVTHHRWRYWPLFFLNHPQHYSFPHFNLGYVEWEVI